MRHYLKKSYISENNKIWQYIKFNKNDCVLCDFIDYVGFYGKRERKRLLTLLASDNGACVYCGRLAVNPSTWKNFRAFVSVCVSGVPVNIIRLQEIKVDWQVVLKVDLYWKGVKLIREEGLRFDCLNLFKNYCFLSDIVLTRADYTVDCAKMNFRKENSLSNKIDWTITKNWELQYKIFWKKSSSSARFIRYYDKKAEISERWTSFLYPEYKLFSTVMRYELQVNSKWFDEYERYLQIEDIYDFVSLGLTVSDNKKKHKREKDDTIYQEIVERFQKLKRLNYKEDLERLKLLFLTTDEYKQCQKDSVRNV